jgi:two-component system, OmpR family, response regulator
MQRNHRRLHCGPPSGAGHSAPSHSGQVYNNVSRIYPKDQRDLRERPLRVLLVEDSELLAQRISELVGELPNIELMGTAGSESDALALLESTKVDAVILDLQLSTGSGFGILRALHRRGSGPSVIVFTNFAINAYRDTALALGALHFLDKSRDYDRLPIVLKELSNAAH